MDCDTHFEMASVDERVFAGLELGGPAVSKEDVNLRRGSACGIRWKSYQPFLSRLQVYNGEGAAVVGTQPEEKKSMKIYRSVILRLYRCPSAEISRSKGHPQT